MQQRQLKEQSPKRSDLKTFIMNLIPWPKTYKPAATGNNTQRVKTSSRSSPAR